MEKVAAAGGKCAGGQGRWVRKAGAAALAACVLGPAALHAQEAKRPAAPPADAVVVAQARTDAVALAQSRGEAGLRMQVQTSAVPRIDAQEAGFQAPRVDVSVGAANAGGKGVGAVLGLSSPPSATAAAATPQGLQPRTSVDMGLRYTQGQVDVTGWRRMNAVENAYAVVDQIEPQYGARVEMNLGSRKGPFAFEKGFLGLQMEGGGRITVKRKNGGAMVYYRNNF